MELSWRWLWKKSAKRSRTSSYLPPTSARINAAKDIPSTPNSPNGKADDITPSDYDLPIPSQMTIPSDYERDDDYDNKDVKLEGGDILVKEAGQPNTQLNNTI